MSVVPIFTASLNERTSGLYVGTLKDETGALVLKATLQAAVMSLFALKSGTIVNGWNRKDMLDPSSGWTFYDALQSLVINGDTVTYNLAWQMTPADATILDGKLATEVHVAEMEMTWASGTRGMTHRFRLNVANLRTVS